MKRNSHLPIAGQIKELEWLLVNEPNAELRQQYRNEYEELVDGRKVDRARGKGDVGVLGPSEGS
jgi:hypothetical protein